MQSAHNLSSEGQIARRPDLFRALGAEDPPPVIALDKGSYRLVTVLKHDSWAATALYENDRGDRAACKLNRVHRLFLFPMGWLGRRLAQREQRVLQLVQGKPGFPQWAGLVHANGRVLANAVAHEWIQGRTFKPWLPVDEHFFPRLRLMIAELHSLGIAYIDMSKWENILIGDDGQPYLLDYQVHVRLPGRGPLGRILRRLQSADLYYLHRHWLRSRPDQFPPQERARWTREPILIHLVERLSHPWRLFRRTVLRTFGVRGDPRKVVESASPTF